MPVSASNPIICATARLARGLKTAHNRAQRADGLDQWPTLPALTLGQWLDDVLDAALLRGEVDAANAPKALNNLQERLLWERAIAAALADEVMAALFDRAGMACAAQEANRLLLEQRVELGNAHTEETREFLRWREQFRQLCAHSGSLEGARYLDWQIECLRRGAGELPEAIELAGFERINPQLQQLFDVLAQRGVRIAQRQTGLDQPAKASHAALADREAECRAAVAWAAGQLGQNPQAHIAIVAPELAVVRQRLAALLDEALHPATVAPALAEAPRSYDFSLGLPLAAQPMIAAALDLLRLAVQPRVSQDDFGALLLQPYWSAGISEADARARLDARMREKLPLTVSLQRLLRFTRHAAEEGEYRLGVDRLAADFGALVEQYAKQPRRQLPSAWAAAFHAMLAAAHWPGERGLSSHEYQAKKAFAKALQSLAAFDALLEPVSASEAVHSLDQICQEQIFQAEVVLDTPIQVMGMLEAAAEPFDAMWVMGMNDHLWPPPPRPNPLLPAALQRAERMPNADSATQAEFAGVIHERLLHSARALVFSSALKDGDRELRESPLLAGIAPLAETSPLAVTLAEILARDGGDLCFEPDHVAPPIAEGERVVGGTGLLKAQAICPAWAYYQYRLGARALKAPLDGLEPTERGTLVHSVLELCWRDPALGEGHAALQAMAPQALESLVLQAADAALQRFAEQRHEPLSPAFLALERERLAKLALAWLAMETARPQPFRVTACEQPHTLDIEGVEIRLVLDRIDTLDDGRLVLLDYKTGQKPDFRNWAEARLREPQLPVYAALCLTEGDVAAVCFGMVRAEEHGFAGIAAEAELLHGVSGLDDKKGRGIFSLELFPHWPALIEHWKRCTENIVRELKAGEAAARFEDEKLLAYCEVLPLLRLPERRLQFERRQASVQKATA